MAKKKRQFVTVGILGVLLVVALIYRLSGGAATPTPTAASPFMADDVRPEDAIADIHLGDGRQEWKLPTRDELGAVLGTQWTSPATDPFTMSERILHAVGGRDESATATRREQHLHPIQRSPPFTVRSTFSVAGRWSAEIDDRSYQEGDVVDGFLITRIRDAALWVVPVDQVAASDLRASGHLAHKPNCVMKVGSAVMAYSGGRWFSPEQRTATGVVTSVSQDGISYRQTPDTAPSDGPVPYDQIEVRVTDAHKQE